MAERVNPVAVAVRHGPCGVDRKVSTHELHAYRRTCGQRVFVCRNHRPETRSAAYTGNWLNADSFQVARERFKHVLRYSGKSHRRGNRNNGLTDVWRQRSIAGGSSAELRGKRRRQRVKRSVHALTDQCFETNALARSRLLFFLTLLEDIDHVFDWGDAGDGLFCERKRIGDRPHELAIDIDRAAAHPSEHSGAVDKRSAQPRDHQTLSRIGHPFKRSQDLNFEALWLRALKNAHTVALHSGANLIQRH